MRDAIGECGPIADGRLARAHARRHRRRGRHAGRRGVRAARRARRRRERDRHRARRQPTRRPPRRNASASTSSSSSRTSRWRSTTAASRCTRTSSGSSNRRGSRPRCRAGDPPLSLADLRDIELTRLKGVGPALAEQLHDLGLENVLDLLQHYPRRWVDRTQAGRHRRARRSARRRRCSREVRSARGRRTRQGRSLVEVVVHDGTSLLNITFFNQPWRDKQLTVGHRSRVLRQARRVPRQAADDEPGRRRHRARGCHRRQDRRDRAGLPAVGEGRGLHLAAARAGRRTRSTSARRAGSPNRSTTAILDREDLVDRTTALRAIHRPESMAELEAAKKRLIFDEFLRMQVGLVARKRALEAEQSGIEHDVDGGLVAAFIAHLPFPLTGDQAARDRGDHARPGAARRRCTGCCRARSDRARPSSRSPRCSSRCRAGTRARSWRPPRCSPSSTTSRRSALLDGLTVPATGHAARRSGRCGSSCSPTARPAAERRRLGAGLAAGEVDIVVGTHALLYGDAEFTRARGRGDRRAAPLRRRAARAAARQGLTTPDVLVMTATPIPRTAAMLVYGDLDKSELREMPPGRTPIATEVVGPDPIDQERGVGPPAQGGRGRPPGVRRLPARRGQGPRSRPRPRPRSSSGSQPRSSPGSGSGCCTAR